VSARIAKPAGTHLRLGRLVRQPDKHGLNDAEYDAVQAAAAPIHPLERGAFLQALAEELERHPLVGPGLVFRLAATLQRRYVVEARHETHQNAPRHGERVSG
jgi:hypothetical protein